MNINWEPPGKAKRDVNSGRTLFSDSDYSPKQDRKLGIRKTIVVYINETLKSVMTRTKLKHEITTKVNEISS